MDGKEPSAPANKRASSSDEKGAFSSDEKRASSSYEKRRSLQLSINKHPALLQEDPGLQAENGAAREYGMELGAPQATQVKTNVAEVATHLPRLRRLTLKPGTMSGRATFFEGESPVSLAINWARASSAAASSMKRG